MRKTFRGIKGNNFNEQKAQKLLELAKSSIYQGNGVDERAYVIKSHIRVIKLLQEELKELENEMLKLFYQAPQLNSNNELNKLFRDKVSQGRALV